MSPEPIPPAPPRRRWFVILLVIVLVTVSGISLVTNLTRQQQRPGAVAQTATTQGFEPLEIVTATGTHRYQVEVMRKPEERGRGLMHRQSMPQNQGMLFDFETDQPVSMWMKNTYISLDMVFILADGRVHRVEERTETLSERTIPSGAPVRAVLELNAGQAKAIGLKPGDRIRHVMFGP